MSVIFFPYRPLWVWEAGEWEEERGFCFFTAQEDGEEQREINTRTDAVFHRTERAGLLLSSYSLSSDFRFHFRWTSDFMSLSLSLSAAGKRQLPSLYSSHAKIKPTFWSVAHIPLSWCTHLVRQRPLFSMRGILSIIFADFISNQSLFRFCLYLSCYCCCSRASVIAREGEKECDSNSKGITFAYQTEEKTSNIVPEIIKL